MSSNSILVRLSNGALAARLGVPLGSVVRVAGHSLPGGREASDRHGSRVVVNKVAYDFLEDPTDLARLLASTTGTAETVGRLVEAVGAQLPEQVDVAAEIRAAVAAEEQRAIELAAEAQATRFTRFEPEILAAAEALGAAPKEIRSVRRVDGDIRVDHIDGTTYLIVDRERPDGAGRYGVLLARQLGAGTGMPTFVPRPGLVARGRARRAAKRTARATTSLLVSAPTDPVLAQLEADLANADAELERRPGHGPTVEERAALTKVIQAHKGRLASEHAAAHPKPPSATDIAFWKATRGWADDMIAARSEHDIAATRSKWASIEPATFAYAPHHARLERNVANSWFETHGLDPDAA